MSSPTPRPAVVLVHGWPITEAHWRHLLPVLEHAGLTTVPVTLPGLGGELDPIPSFRKLDLARWLGSVLAHRGITRFALIGHDWGATVASFLAAESGSAVSALVVEEEILPGIDVDLEPPGNEHYPTWHGPFNRSDGLAELLVPGRESAYYGAFLRESAGPAGLDRDTMRSYIDAYSAAGILEAGLGYYRSRRVDLRDVRTLVAKPVEAPVLAIGGRFAMGSAVAEGMRFVASDVTGLVADRSGHYPVEQEPDSTGRAVLQFILRHSPTIDAGGW